MFERMLSIEERALTLDSENLVSLAGSLLITLVAVGEIM